METGFIRSPQISASSFLDHALVPDQARLNGDRAWCAATTDSSPSITVALLSNVHFLAVVVQGLSASANMNDHANAAGSFLTKYQVQLSHDGVEFRKFEVQLTSYFEKH